MPFVFTGSKVVRSNRFSDFCKGTFLVKMSNAEIRNKWMVETTKQNITGFYVTMNNPKRMSLL